jgi:thioredoxin reductase (NADPH)
MHELIIIGAGPAGLTAALYAGRFKMNTLVLEKMSAGGQILFSPAIENYPGFPEGISTFDLIDKFKKQVEDLGIKIENSEALEISSGENSYYVKTQGSTYETKTVIISAGASAKQLGVKGEEKLTGRGVSYCGTCDGPIFKSKDIVVVGGGDRAVEDALFLTNYANSVHLIHRRNELRASKILVDKAKVNPKIRFILESVVEEITGDKKVEGVRIRNLKTGQESAIACEGIFIFVGIRPNTAFLKNILEMDENGFIITDQKMHTSCQGVFACGDCRKKSLYQVISACSDGATAADSAHKYLLKQ